MESLVLASCSASPRLLLSAARRRFLPSPPRIAFSLSRTASSSAPTRRRLLLPSPPAAASFPRSLAMAWQHAMDGSRAGGSQAAAPAGPGTQMTQQYAQRSRVRKLQYIAELERKVQALQSEGIEVSAEMEFLTQQNIMLGMENKTLKQMLESLTQEQLIKRWPPNICHWCWTKHIYDKASGSSSISSADLFGRDVDDSNMDVSAADLINRISFQASQDLSSLKNMAGETRKKLTSIASNIMSQRVLPLYQLGIRTMNWVK